LALLTLVLAALLWFPLLRISAYVEINNNEGWNAYRQSWAARGIPLYAEPPNYLGTDYPPIAWHLVGWLGRAMGNFWKTGRWVSILAYAGVCVAAAAVVRRLTGQTQAALLCLLCCALWIPLQSAERIGMNDPQLVGMALSTAGLYCYARSAGARGWLAASAVLFCLGGFAKHNLIAWPLAVAGHLLLTDRRRFLSWCLVMMAAGGALIVAIRAVDGPYLFQHILKPRVYLPGQTWGAISNYLRLLPVPLVVALAWSWRYGVRHQRGILVLGFAISHLTAFTMAGGSGVDDNIFLDAVVAVALLAGVAWADIQPALARLHPPAGVVAALLVAAVLLGAAPKVARTLRRSRQQVALLPSQEAALRDGVDYLRNRPGEALCESFLLCYEAGKELLFAPAYIRTRVRMGDIPEKDVLELIRRRRFQTVQLLAAPDEILEPKDRVRFSAAFMSELLEHYRVDQRLAGWAFLVPK
jgi:4-amino-4-deoxy-L-arabinose transferase-like glycosyltransferase